MIPKIKAVVMSHNQPASTDELYRRLSLCFDVTVFDSGSDDDKRPQCPSERFANLYWTGCWMEAMRRYGDGVDFLWVLGGDVTLLNETDMYIQAMDSLKRYDVACWSPVVEGKSRPFMKSEKALGKVWSVYHVEGQAMALSGKMMRMVGFSFPPGSKLGWGVDVWCCWRGWTSGMRNVLDGRVAIRHPDDTGYNRDEAATEAKRYLLANISPRWPVDARMIPRLETFESNVREETR